MATPAATDSSAGRHTPGPWRALAGVEDEDGNRWGVVTTQGFLVATVENGAPGDTLHTERANALVLAASTDLLGACKSVFAAHRTGGAINWKHVEFAIARAEGRQP